MNHITSSDSIGNSLSTINVNYQTVDNRTFFLNVSSDQIFNPVQEFLIPNFDSFDSLISITMQNSSKWVDMKTTVSTNSSAWIKPISYIHPIILEEPVSITNFYELTSRFSQKYPILNANGYPTYVENQKAYLYYYSYDIVNRLNFVTTKNSNMAQCDCPPTYTIVVQCKDSSKGWVTCDNGTSSCSSCAKSCQKTSTVNCYYENGQNRVYRYLSANINAYFDDRYEKNIKCALFQVKNCKWEFQRYI